MPPTRVTVARRRIGICGSRCLVIGRAVGVSSLVSGAGFSLLGASFAQPYSDFEFVQ